MAAEIGVLRNDTDSDSDSSLFSVSPESKTPFSSTALWGSNCPSQKNRTDSVSLIVTDDGLNRRLVLSTVITVVVVLFSADAAGKADIASKMKITVAVRTIAKQCSHTYCIVFLTNTQMYQKN